MTSISFSKYSGCGNDFILVDNRNKVFPLGNGEVVKRLCHRRYGIGADGIVLLEESPQASYRMRIFNADGSEAEMCGNGLRCLGEFLHELGIPDGPYTIEVMGQTYSLERRGDIITVSMPPPRDIEWEVDVPLEKSHLSGAYLDTGVPHIVFFTKDLENVDIAHLGPEIRHHPLFSPRGANVNFACLSKDRTLCVRTYERGVEQETLACGTGAAAVSIVAARKFQLNSPITILPRSGEKLKFHLTSENGDITQVTMTGPADFIFRGKLNPVLNLKNAVENDF